MCIERALGLGCHHAGRQGHEKERLQDYGSRVLRSQRPGNCEWLQKVCRCKLADARMYAFRTDAQTTGSARAMAVLCGTAYFYTWLGIPKWPCMHVVQELGDQGGRSSGCCATHRTRRSKPGGRLPEGRLMAPWRCHRS